MQGTLWITLSLWTQVTMTIVQSRSCCFLHVTSDAPEAKRAGARSHPRSHREQVYRAERGFDSRQRAAEPFTWGFLSVGGERQRAYLGFLLKRLWTTPLNPLSCPSWSLQTEELGPSPHVSLYSACSLHHCYHWVQPSKAGPELMKRKHASSNRAPSSQHP